jgi:hypothetical protein
MLTDKGLFGLRAEGAAVKKVGKYFGYQTTYHFICVSFFNYLKAKRLCQALQKM